MVGGKDEGLGDRIGGLGIRAGPEVSSLGALPNTCSMYSIISGWNWRTCGICKMCEQYCYFEVRSHKKSMPIYLRPFIEPGFKLLKGYNAELEHFGAGRFFEGFQDIAQCYP